jgi:hypothetical protein
VPNEEIVKKQLVSSAAILKCIWCGFETTFGDEGVTGYAALPKSFKEPCKSECGHFFIKKERFRK